VEIVSNPSPAGSTRCAFKPESALGGGEVLARTDAETQAGLSLERDGVDGFAGGRLYHLYSVEKKHGPVIFTEMRTR